MSDPEMRLEREIDASQRHIKLIRDDLQRANGKVSGLKGTVKALRAKVDSLKDTQAQAKSMREDIRADPATAELWRAISRASSECEELRDLKLSAETSEAAVNELITRLREIADMLETEVSAAELPTVEKELTEYVEKQSEAERMATTMEKKRNAAKAEIDEKSAKLQAMKQRRLGNIASIIDDDTSDDVGLAGLFASPVDISGRSAGERLGVGASVGDVSGSTGRVTRSKDKDTSSKA